MSASNSESSGMREVTLFVHGMTCDNCVRRVKSALQNLSGVSAVELELSQGQALVQYDSAKVDVHALQEAVQRAGYVAGEKPSLPEGEPQLINTAGQPGQRSVLAVALGLAAAAVLVGFYAAILTIAQGWDHAVELFSTDWPFILAITAGFGTQIGLFIYIRTAFRTYLLTKRTSALAGTSTGTSTVSMLACCAHHLTDVLPIIGLAGAAAFLAEYRVPFMLLGIAMNAVGIVVMIRLLRKLRCESCTVQLP